MPYTPELKELIKKVEATRAERVAEAVYYKILGAGSRFVLGVFALEKVLINLARAQL